MSDRHEYESTSREAVVECLRENRPVVLLGTSEEADERLRDACRVFADSIRKHPGYQALLRSLEYIARKLSRVWGRE